MEVDQKHITTIRLHDAKGSDIAICKQGQDYHLKMVSSDNVVNIVLGGHDVRKLCQQIVQLDIQENWRPHVVAPVEYRSFFFGEEPRPQRESMSDWFVKMVKEAHEKAVSR